MSFTASESVRDLVLLLHTKYKSSLIQTKTYYLKETIRWQSIIYEILNKRTVFFFYSFKNIFLIQDIIEKCGEFSDDIISNLKTFRTKILKCLKIYTS